MIVQPPTVRGHAALIIVLALAACGPKGAPPGFPPADVTIVTVQPGSLPTPYSFSGEVVSYRRVEVRARVEGVIEERTFQEGTLVAPGQLLYRLERTRYEGAYRSARARFDNAKRTLDRLEPLVKDRAVSQQDVDNARSELESAQGALDQAQRDLNDTDVKAPMAGQVGRTLLDAGARVTGPNELLTTIDRLDPVYVTFRPSSEQLLAWQQDPAARALVRSGSAIKVRAMLPDGSELPQEGRIQYVAPALDAATGTREIRAQFSNADHLLMPGAFVQVRIIGLEQVRALAVPLRAVQSDLGRQFVYVVGAGDTATRRDVRPGPWVGNLWVIDEGLRAGDRVIVDGVQKVAPGRPVRPTVLTDSAAVPRVAAPVGPGL